VEESLDIGERLQVVQILLALPKYPPLRLFLLLVVPPIYLNNNRTSNNLLDTLLYLNQLFDLLGMFKKSLIKNPQKLQVDKMSLQSLLYTTRLYSLSPTV